MEYTVFFIEVIVSVLLLISGILLLINSKKHSKNKKKKVGSIVIGSITAGIGTLLACYIISQLIMSVAVKGLDNAMSNTNMSLLHMTYTTSDGVAFQYERLAKKGYSGEAIDRAEAKELVDFIYSLPKSHNGDLSNNTISEYGDFEVFRFQHVVSDTDAGKYIYYCEAISKAPDESFVGIQYIRLEKDGDVVKELGAKPLFY